MPLYSVDDEFYFSMSRDLTDQDKPKFHWWEPVMYLVLLAVMFWSEIHLLHTVKL